MGAKDATFPGHGGLYVRLAYANLSQEAEHRIGFLGGLEALDTFGSFESLIIRKIARLDEVLYSEVGIWGRGLSGSVVGGKWCGPIEGK